jgi:hypothetical protein
MPRHIACLSYDFDTWSGFAARGMLTPTPISRGEFGIIGANRIMDLLASRGIKASWYIPGVVIETYPEACARVVAGGHEIGHHGWSHVPPAELSAEREADEFGRRGVHPAADRAWACRLPLPGLGPERPHHRPDHPAWLPLRQQHDGP